MAWFKKTRKPLQPTEKVSRIPEGLWVKCPSCNRALYHKDLEETLQVCPHCGHHFRMSARDRLAMLFDEGRWVEHDAGLVSLDPLGFTDTKPYRGRLDKAIEATGLKDAVIVGSGTLNTIPVVIAAMEYAFIGGSMGVVVGEKITRGAERALADRSPFVVVSCSGGARMMEGALSLMQMAKTTVALERLAAERLPYVAVLSHPTTGGVTASFATLGDVIFAEPGALISFAGPRVIQQTIKQDLPEGFQRAEFLLQKGMVDDVVKRAELKPRLVAVLKALSGAKERAPLEKLHAAAL